MALFENDYYYSTGDLYINKTVANKHQRIENILHTVLAKLSENLSDIVGKLLHIFNLGVDVSPFQWGLLSGMGKHEKGREKSPKINRLYVLQIDSRP